MVSVNQYHGGKQKSHVCRKSWYQKKKQLALNEFFLNNRVTHNMENNAE